MEHGIQGEGNKGTRKFWFWGMQGMWKTGTKEYREQGIQVTGKQ